MQYIKDLNGHFLNYADKKIVDFDQLRKMLKNNTIFYTNENENKSLIEYLEQPNDIILQDMRGLWDKIGGLKEVLPYKYETIIDNAPEYYKLLLKKYKYINKMENVKGNIVSERIEDLKKYVELEFPCEIIEEIEVKLESWHIHEDIALVDLPGLNVDNKNHKELTKKISQELNAFIIIDGEKTVEGELKELISSLKEDIPKLFGNSYLIKSKMDWITSDEKHFEEKIENFENLRKDLNISEENTFKVSAQDFLDNKESLYKIEFIKFKNKLFDDSKEKLVKDFYRVINDDLSEIYSKISTAIEMKKLSINKFEGDKDLFIRHAARNRFKEHELEIKNKIDSIQKYYNHSEELWGADHSTKLTRKLKNVLDELNEDYQKKSLMGKDIHNHDSSKIFECYFEHIKINQLLRADFYKYIEDVFYKDFKEFLEKEYLNNDFIMYLPELKKNELKNLLVQDSLKERLNAIIDIILYDYIYLKRNWRERFICLYDLFIETNSDEKTKENLLESLNTTQFYKIALEVDEFNLEDLNTFYSINDKDNPNTIIKKIILKDFEVILGNLIQDKLNNYSIAIKKNYLEDVKTGLSLIFNSSEYEIEFERNFENKEKAVLEKRYNSIVEEIEKLETIKKNLEII